MKRRYKFALVTMGFLISLLLGACHSNELSKPDNEAGLNGSFETTDSGYLVNWAFFPNPETNGLFQVSIDTTKAQEGRQSLQLYNNQSEKTVGFRSRRVVVEPSKTYKLSFAIQKNDGHLKVRRIVQDKSGTDNRRSEIIVDTSSTSSNWETFEETLAIAEGERHVVLIFLFDGPGRLWVDHVRVEEVIE